jgi:uncharacterized protein (UPF0332 family)
VTKEEARQKAVDYWRSKAHESLAAARDEAAAGRLSFAINRCYFALFYSASAVLLKKGRQFKKHSGVRAAVHRDLVKTGALSSEWGQFYDRLFQERQTGDYLEFVEFAPDEVQAMIEQSVRLVETLEGLLANGA